LRLAVVDIGSNAIRCQITKVLRSGNQVTFKKIEYIRYPIRFGEDVFKSNEIGPVKEQKFYKLMNAFKLLFDVYDVEDYMICATSAMRESVNGRLIADNIKKDIGLHINIIDGETEAEYINKIVYSSLDDENYLHIDVGGGSTEINFYSKKVKMFSQSFKVGSVRMLNHADTPEMWAEMQQWLENNIPNDLGPITAIGTGGNIDKIFELSKIKSKEREMSRFVIERTINFVKKYSVEERINILMLNPDRADVIVPASEIYLSAMKWGGATKMIVPDVALKDGMIQILYQKHFSDSDDVYKKVITSY
jgi:exopolyphosphatase / guanosine-5'-triphosphate,3'-diphosphate pyrophosphatase